MHNLSELSETFSESDEGTSAGLSATEGQDQLVQFFKVLGDQKRLSVVLHLRKDGELHVSELCQRLEQSQPAVSHHLGLMLEAGLIARRREGKHNYYSLQDHPGCEMLEQMMDLLKCRPGQK
jgi:ArsR family transcriptional regulator, arsenate/arsenite/antimonite-responsive transcriptional repressor